MFENKEIYKYFLYPFEKNHKVFIYNDLFYKKSRGVFWWE